MCMKKENLSNAIPLLISHEKIGEKWKNEGSFLEFNKLLLEILVLIQKNMD